MNAGRIEGKPESTSGKEIGKHTAEAGSRKSEHNHYDSRRDPERGPAERPTVGHGDDHDRANVVVLRPQFLRHAFDTTQAAFLASSSCRRRA